MPAPASIWWHLSGCAGIAAVTPGAGPAPAAAAAAAARPFSAAPSRACVRSGNPQPPPIVHLNLGQELAAKRGGPTSSTTEGVLRMHCEAGGTNWGAKLAPLIEARARSRMCTFQNCHLQRPPRKFNPRPSSGSNKVVSGEFTVPHLPPPAPSFGCSCDEYGELGVGLVRWRNASIHRCFEQMPPPGQRPLLKSGHRPKIPTSFPDPDGDISFLGLEDPPNSYLLTHQKQSATKLMVIAGPGRGPRDTALRAAHPRGAAGEMPKKYKDATFRGRGWKYRLSEWIDVLIGESPGHVPSLSASARQNRKMILN
eukprot:gene22212-biopygen17705